MANKEIYMVEAFNDNYDEGEVRIPLVTFMSMDDAEDHAGLCADEATRIQSDLKAYWKKHNPEMQRLTDKMRSELHNKTYKKGSPDELRRVELFTGAKEIENSHKYHPDLPIYDNLEVHYEITPIELRS